MRKPRNKQRQQGSAGFQPAVSPISNRQCTAGHVCAEVFERRAGWKHCDTAGWKPALRFVIRVFHASPLLANVAVPAFAQPVVPPQAIAQFQQVVGNRAEAAIILGGDYGATGGIYTFRGGRVAELSVAKLGGGGNVSSPRPLGMGDIQWAAVLQGNLGHFTADNDFSDGYLQGNRLSYDVLAVQGGFGARFYFNDHFSLAPTISGIYGHTENEFKARNALGEAVKAAASGTFVDWTIDTWSVQPGLDLDYGWLWGRTTFDFSSRYNYFYTESFNSSSPVVCVSGGAQTWQNKLDAGVPLGWKVIGRQFHHG